MLRASHFSPLCHGTNCSDDGMFSLSSTIWLSGSLRYSVLTSCISPSTIARDAFGIHYITHKHKIAVRNIRESQESVVRRGRRWM